MTERECILVLHSVLGAGPGTLKEMEKRFAPLEAIFDATEAELGEIQGVGPRRVERLLQADPDEMLLRLKQEMEETGCQVITVADREYPPRLREQKGAPIALFYQGDLSCLDRPVVSIVGTRRASPYGGQVAYSMARELTIQDVMVMSGMAIGIDTQAHQGALEEGATVAVLGSGLGTLYPPQNRGLAERIREAGLLLSPFTPGTAPARWTFPRRNQVMAALSLGVVVVEAGEKSGALLTAQYAKEMDVHVFAVPGRVDRSQAQGVLQLLKDGAKVAAGAVDVLEQLSIPSGPVASTGSPPCQGLEGRELAVWNALEAGDLPAEVLAEMAGIDLVELWEVLLEMEMKGLISQAPGGVYSRRVM